MEADHGTLEELRVLRALEDLRAHIGRRLEEQRLEFRSVADELRDDVRQMLHRRDEDLHDIQEGDDPSSEIGKTATAEDSHATAMSNAVPTTTIETGPGITISVSEAEPARAEQQDQPADGVGARREVGYLRHATKSWLTNLLGGVVWEWQRADESWEAYAHNAGQRIEQAFWRGETMTHVKSGKDGRTPMEIFFVDMVQLDPVSGRVRHIRRGGIKDFPFVKYPWMWMYRRMSGLAYELASGRPQFESLKDYKARERQELATSGLIVEASEGDGFDFIGVNVDCAELSSKRHFRRKLFLALTSNFLFTATSITFTILQAVYMGATLHRDDASLDLWKKGAEIIALEYFFCTFFLFELVMRYLALPRISEGFRDAWFCYDTVCVALSIFEVVVLPLLRLATLVDASTASTQAFRVIRVGRVFRFVRLFRQLRDLNVVIRGFVHGMRSVIYILAMMGILVFAFAYCVQTAILNDDFRRERFSSIGKSMRTLTFAGILLDGVHKLGNEFVAYEEYGAMFVFSIFVLISYFGLLNMLIGSFCNTAMLISQQEDLDADIRRLGLSLRGLLECYLSDGDQTMTRQQFKLIMKNMQVHKILRSCGTDIEALLMLEDILFPTERSELHFNKFFGVVSRLRASAPACVSHMVCIAASIDHLLQQLKQADARSPPPPRGSGRGLRPPLRRGTTAESDASNRSFGLGLYSPRPAAS